ncbi:MAG: hypothetical protein IM607_09345 [Cytophagales bacterium]|jgi:hypothetical protein|nr:hypothetical protein [Cytophagales bacterium]
MEKVRQKLALMWIIYGMFDVDSLFIYRKIKRTGVSMNGIKAKLNNEN